MVGIDLYVNETLAHCDYVLPAATMYERDDFPLPFQTLQPTPFRQATEAVVAPAGQARAEWEIIDDLTQRLWRRTPGLIELAVMRKTMSLFGVRLTPRLLVDAIIRLGEGGDLFGLRRGGLTFSRLTAAHPHGKVLAPNLREGVLRNIVVYRGGRVRCGTTTSPPRSRRCREASRGLSDAADRHARDPSENSWMHNAPLLMRGERVQPARIHVDDAAAATSSTETGCGSPRCTAKSNCPSSSPRTSSPAWWRFRTAGATRAPPAGGWPSAPAVPTSTS